MDDSRIDDLSSIRPEDWANIPSPIVRAIGVLIKKMKANEQDISIINQSIHSFEQKVDGKFQQFLSKLDSVWGSIADMDEKFSQPHVTPKGKKDSSDPLGEVGLDVNQMKTRVKDLEKQVKELKLMQLKQDEKLLAASGEFSRSIEDAKEAVLKEVAENMIEPEVTTLEEKLAKFEGSSKMFSLELKKNIDDVAFHQEALKGDHGKLRKEVVKLQETQDDCLSQTNQLTNSAERVEVRLRQLKTSSETELANLAKELRDYQATFTSTVSTQMTDLRQMVEASASTSDSYFNSKITEFANALIFPVLTSQRNDLELALSVLDNKIRQELFILSKNLQNAFKKTVVEGVERKIVILEEKLKWLPLDTKEIKNMTPYEARLFTIETRLRTEEDRRLLAQERISSDLEFLRRTVTPASVLLPEPSVVRNPISQVFANELLPRRTQKKVTTGTPGGMATPEMWRKLSPRRQTVSQLAVRSKRSNPYAVNLSNPYDIPDSKESQAEMQHVYQNFTPTKYHTGRSAEASVQLTNERNGYAERKLRVMSNFTEPIQSEAALPEPDRLDLSSF